MLRGSFGCKPWVKRASKSKGDSGEEDEEENEVKKACNENIVKNGSLMMRLETSLRWN